MPPEFNGSRFSRVARTVTTPGMPGDSASTIFNFQLFKSTLSNVGVDFSYKSVASRVFFSGGRRAADDSTRVRRNPRDGAGVMQSSVLCRSHSFVATLGPGALCLTSGR